MTPHRQKLFDEFFRKLPASSRRLFARVRHETPEWFELYSAAVGIGMEYERTQEPAKLVVLIEEGKSLYPRFVAACDTFLYCLPRGILPLVAAARKEVTKWLARFEGVDAAEMFRLAEAQAKKDKEGE